MNQFVATTSGTVAGIAGVVAGHPFDTVKVRLQSQGSAIVYSGPFDCLLKTIRNENVNLCNL